VHNKRIASTLRRSLGRYDTPRPLSQAVADWAVRSPNDEALEPSSGSGVFILSLAHRLRQLGQKSAIDQLWACDIDSAACTQTIQATGLNKRHIWNADFLSLISTDGINGRKFDCIVGNPPYISLHRMSVEQRQRVSDSVDRLKLDIGRRASLWAYFLSASIHALRLHGRVAFILPESILHAEYALAIVRTFAKSFVRCSLVSLRERCFILDGAAERVVVLLADDFRSVLGQTEISLHECVTADSAISFLTSLRNGTASALPSLNGHAVPHLLPPTAEPIIELATVKQSYQLGDFVDIKIGVVTGADQFFLLSESQREKLKLRRAWLMPVVPRFKECHGLTFCRKDWRSLRDRGQKCWLLAPSPEITAKALLSYLATFPVESKKLNRTFTKRKHWFSPVPGRKAHAFLRYMGTAGPRLAFARFNVNCTNIIHRVYFHKDVSVLKRKAILLSLHSSYSQLSAEFEGRAYGSGVLKLEPSEGRRIRFLLPEKLNKNVIDACFKAANKLMKKGDSTGATAVIDDWLFHGIQSLQAALPRQRLFAVLKTTIQRRLGYPQHFMTAVIHRNGSIDSASENQFSPSTLRNTQSAALKSYPRQIELLQAK